MSALARFRAHTPMPGYPGAEIAARPAREPRLAEVLARLEVAATLGDTDAAARLLDGLALGSGGGCGVWLHRQMAAAALRALAHTITT